MTTPSADNPPTDPDERARIYERYRKALVTERDLKPLVQAMAAQDLTARVASVTDLARSTGMTAEVFRRLARKLDVPVDPRYEERAAAIRKKPAAED